ncbi:MAG: class I tRNA ligase family protein, partial [Acidimicrobiales bacterium]
SKGVLVDQTDYDHSYPHCWRTDTPLIYRAVSSWFVRVTELKERLLERNQEIEWVPAHVRDGAFGKWLEGARDWALTRNRYWGTPIPVWQSDDPKYPRVDVYGSLDEIEADFGVRPENLHRPHIDELTRPNPDDPTGTSRMVRVTDVLDCWFESGSMPYAQLHYPFDNKQRFEDNFPADFIVEYIGQTRGWFYTLHVLSVALFDKPPFQHCMAHGILLGEDGRKLSKRLANYPDPWEVFEELGADAMRWFLLSSSVLRGQEMSLSKSAMFDTVKRAINPIWNAYYFLTLYGNADRIRGEERYDSPNLLDRYILAKAGDMARAVTASMERFDLSEATAEIERYLDALTNWYIRRSRERFWSKAGTSNGNDEDKQRAYDTLHTVLLLWTKVAAPLLPMLTEEIYQGLTGERSVHLADWPEVDELPSDPELVAGMDLVREVCSLGHSIRKAQGLRARLPLARAIISGERARLLAPYVALISEELNVKEVELQSDFDAHADHVLNVVPSQVGPRLGSDTPKVMAGARAGDWSIDDGVVTVRGVTLLEGEFQLLLRPKNPDSTRVMAARDGVVSLDLEITESLAKEGLARDVVREIQAMRKDADLHITDHIAVTLHLVDDQGGTLSDALRAHHSYIAEQVLADQLLINEQPATTGTLTHGVSIGEGKLDIEIMKVMPR